MSTTTAIVLLTVIPLLLSPVFNYYGNRRWILYFPIVAISFGVLYIGHLWIQNGSNSVPFFSVNRHTALVSVEDDPMHSGWWMVYEMGNELLKSPITHCVYVALTNTGPGPLRITSYSVEARETGAKWKFWSEWSKVTRLPPHGDSIFYVGSRTFDKAIKMDFDDTLEKAITNRSIPSNDTVTGWIFLETPKKLTGEKTLEWRVRVRDIRNMESVAPLASFPTGTYENVGEGASSITRGIQDISSSRPALYSKVHWR